MLFVLSFLFTSSLLKYSSCLYSVRIKVGFFRVYNWCQWRMSAYIIIRIFKVVFRRTLGPNAWPSQTFSEPHWHVGFHRRMIEPKGQDHNCHFCAKALVYRWDMGLIYWVFDLQVEVRFDICMSSPLPHLCIRTSVLW